MRKKNNIYVIKLSKKTILSLSIIFLLISSIIFLKNIRFIEIFKTKSKNNKIIVIDPGHGGIDGGASDKEGFLEKNVNLDIGLKLEKELEKEGFNVIMTRKTDKSLEELSNIDGSRYRKDLDARKNIINRNEHFLFVSIHANSNIKSQKVRGMQIYYYPSSEDSKKLAEAICYSVNENIYKNFLKTDMVKANILPQDYFILRETFYPGVLIETGFITNPIDKSLLKNEEYKAKVAFSIKEGIKKYIEWKNLKV